MVDAVENAESIEEAAERSRPIIGVAVDDLEDPRSPVSRRDWRNWSIQGSQGRSHRFHQGTVEESCELEVLGFYSCLASVVGRSPSASAWATRPGIFVGLWAPTLLLLSDRLPDILNEDALKQVIVPLLHTWEPSKSWNS